jgi:hypothetical protein
MKYQNPRHDYKVDGKDLDVGDLGKKTTPKAYKRGGRVKGFEMEEDEPEDQELEKETKRGRK